MKATRFSIFCIALIVFVLFGCEGRKNIGAKNVSAEDSTGAGEVEKVYPPGTENSKANKKSRKDSKDMLVIRTASDKKKVLAFRNFGNGLVQCIQYDPAGKVKSKFSGKFNADKKTLAVRDGLTKKQMGQVVGQKEGFIVRPAIHDYRYLVRPNAKGVLVISKQPKDSKKASPDKQGESDFVVEVTGSKKERIVVRKGRKKRDKVGVVKFVPKSAWAGISDKDGNKKYVALNAKFSPLLALPLIELPDDVKAMIMLEMYRQES